MDTFTQTEQEIIATINLEFSTTRSKLISKLISDEKFLNNPDELRTQLLLAEEEALFASVYKLIKINNEILINRLKSEGINI